MPFDAFRLLLMSTSSFNHERVSEVFSFESESLNLFSRMTTEPTEERKLLINKTIKDLKNAGLWSKLDEIWVFAANNSQSALLGWKNYQDATEQGAVEFVVDSGYTPKTTGSGYVLTNYNPASHSINFGASDCCGGVWVNNSLTTNTHGLLCGRPSSGTTVENCLFFTNTSGVSYRINTTSAVTGAYATVSNTGLYLFNKVSTTVDLWVNGGKVSTRTGVTGPALPNSRMAVGAIAQPNTTILANSYANNINFSFAFLGGSLSDTEQVDFYNILSYYKSNL